MIYDFLGDIDQCDNKTIIKAKEKSGLEYAMDKLEGLDDIGLIKFDKNDKSVRNPIIDKILQKWD